jgi:hypothetical protein
LLIPSITLACAILSLTLASECSGEEVSETGVREWKTKLFVACAYLGIGLVVNLILAVAVACSLWDGTNWDMIFASPAMRISTCSCAIAGFVIWKRNNSGLYFPWRARPCSLAECFLYWLMATLVIILLDGRIWMGSLLAMKMRL